MPWRAWSWCPEHIKAPQEVVWEIYARTRGWLGFGFSSNGGMGGADIVTAWVRDGQLHLQDRHGVGPEMPPEDETSDWRPLYARENDTHTMLVVARDVNTCDHHDYPLTVSARGRRGAGGGRKAETSVCT